MADHQIAIGMTILEAAIDAPLARATKLPPISFVLDGEPWSFDTRSRAALFSRGLVADAGLTLRCSAALFWRMFTDVDFALRPDDVVEADGAPGLLRQLSQLFRAPEKLWSVQFP